ncbi:MAG: hypothetical protein RLZZ244_2326, partial [Verrucomicrobiota bacterium]
MNCAKTEWVTSRRDFLQRTGAGFGWLAFCALQTQRCLANMGSSKEAPNPHHTPFAKHVIFLMMDGGPSHLDTFDYKPKIARADFDPSPFEFRAFGKSGLRMANIFPNLS